MSTRGAGRNAGRNRGRRLREERDEYREAARDADGQRIALQRVLRLEAVAQ